MRMPILLGVLALFVACRGDLLDPEATSTRSALSESGIEHRLEVSASVDEGVGSFVVTSVLVNTSGRPATLKVRSCYLRESDLRGSTQGLKLSQPLMLCATAAHEVTLAPGTTSDTLEISGQAPGGSTRHLEVRHAVAPEEWTALTLAFP